MADDTHRSVVLERLEEGVYLARNARGAELRFGSFAGDAFTPVELLLAALGGCTAVDVDVVTGRRATPESFVVRVDAEKVREDGQSVLRDVQVTFRVAFGDGDDGDAARAALPRAVEVSHDRTCTITRTLERGAHVAVVIED